MGRFSNCVAAVTAVLCLVSSAAAQGRAALRISVEDELGGVIGGVTLTLVHKVSGETHVASSDNAGRAAFEALSTGEYVLKAEAPGFALLQQTVTVGPDPAPLKLKLKIEVTEEVTIAADLPSEQRTAPDQNADTIAFNNTMLTGLPLPLGTQQLTSFIADFLSPMAGGQGDPTVIVDGMEVSNIAVPTAAINQILVNKNPYSSEYRKLGKARVEIITEDGSRRHYNANVGLTFTNSALDSLNAFAPQKPDSHKNLTEMGFSGPLGQKLGSFLVSGQHLSNQQNSVVNALTLAGPLNTTMPTNVDYTVAFGRADLKLTSADRLRINYDFVQNLQSNLDVGGLLLPELAVARQSNQHTLRFVLDTKLSKAAANELRVRVEKSRTSEGGPINGPSLDVQGAFEGGFNQNFLRNESPTLDIRDTMSYFRRVHAIRFGGSLRVSRLDMTDAKNFGGTFQFANLDMLSAGRPSLFRINQGDPSVAFSRNEGELYFQDDMKLRPNLTLMAGVRYDLSPQLSDFNNVSPRVAVAYAPGLQRTVVRVGTGMFYANFSERIRERSLLYDGVRTRELVISNPAYPNPFAAGEARTILPSIVRLEPGLTLPFQVQTTVAVERELRPRTLVSVEYAHVTGSQLFRATNPNAPLPNTGVRPDPNVLNITQVESSGTMESNGLTFTLNTRLAKVLKSAVIYTYSRSTDNTGGPFSLPANNFNLAAEMGPADFDVRHKFNMATVLTLKHGVQVGAVLNVTSGAPFDITTGFDDNGDGLANDRPTGVTRNSGRGPGLTRLDLRFTKLFLLPRPAWSGKDNPGQLELNLDAFNALNNANLNKPVGVVSSPFFGQSISAQDPRTIQLSIRYRF